MFPFQTLLTRLLLALGLALGLAACGGGGSSSTPLNVSPGVYSGTINNKEWLTVLTPNQSGSNNWFSLYFINDVPDVYSGVFSVIGSSTLNSSSVSFFRYPSVRTGTGSMTSPAVGQISQTLSFPSVGIVPAEVVTVSPSKPNLSTFNFDTASSLAALQGTWTGRLSYGKGSVTPYSLDINAYGSLVVPTSNFDTDCRISSGSLSQYGGNVNLFTVQMHIPQTTVCDLSKDTVGGVDLTGIAYISSNPTRLQIIATLSGGKGLSFRADR